MRRAIPAVLPLLIALLVAVAPAGPRADGLADLRAQLDRAGPGRWLELDGNASGTIPGTAISRVFPRREGHPAWAVVGPRSVVIAWSGAAYDHRRDMLFVFGGGHNDYGGNEVYLFDMARREWARVTQPSRYDENRQTVDGTPISRHSYDGMQYLPGPDRMFVFGGSIYPSGKSLDRTVWFFDMDHWRWSRGGDAPFSAFPASAYDPATGLVYVSSATGLRSYDAARDRWESASRGAAWLGNGTAAFDPVRRYYVELTRRGTHYYDLSRPSPAAVERLRPPVQGDINIEERRYPGIEYDPVRRRLFAWSGGRETWSLDTGTFRWTKHANEAGPAPEQEGRASRGVYGRWRYVPRLDAFIGFNDPDENVWLYRPPMVNGGN